MKPIDCLKKQLAVWESALQHSRKSYQYGTISKELHEQHEKNLSPLIDMYNKAIQTLQNEERWN